jgi:hypothetical protein
MHTANLSSLRSAIQDYFSTDESDWLADFDLVPKRDLDPHILEHETRAAELLDDEDAAWIHDALGQNMKRAARDSN